MTEASEREGVAKREAVEPSSGATGEAAPSEAQSTDETSRTASGDDDEVRDEVSRSSPPEAEGRDSEASRTEASDVDASDARLSDADAPMGSPDDSSTASDPESPNPEPSVKPQAPAKRALPENVARAARAFVMGGRALDPNEPTPPDPVLARVLFAEAATNAARALLGDTHVALEPALDALTSRGELGRILGRRAASAGTFAILLSETAPSVASMRDIEPSVAKLVQAAHGKRTLVFGERIRLALVALFVVTAIAATAVFFARQPPWKQYRYTTSTTQAGYTSEGTLGSVGMSGLIFHTQEELAPWVEIDLGKVRKVSRITLTQRDDCCQERGIPLVVQVAGEDKKWIDVARKKEKFDVWEARFRARKARYVRLTSPAKTIIHYADVKIQ